MSQGISEMGNSDSPEALANKTLQRKLLSFPNSDAGNAEAFELLHGHRFRYNHTSGKWLVWTGRCWIEDKDGEANRAALETVRARLPVAASIKDKEERRESVEWVLYCEAVWRLEAMLKCARTIRSLATSNEQYDQDPFLLTVANGTVDLRTGRLQKSRPENLITRATDVAFEPNAKASRWTQFLREVFGNNSNLIGFIQRAVGYSLTGDTREQCFFILVGCGANGKSTFVETVSKLLGTHAETAEFTTFLARKNSGSPRNDLARLHSARFVKAAEGEHQAPLAESIIKELTGEDTIAARFLFKEHFTFKPQFKIWLITNHKPQIRGTDDAIWRRVRLIEFNQQFLGTKMDPELRQKLEGELPGIFAWAVKGCLAWQRHGLGLAPRVVQATAEYRQESDQVGRFLKECSRREPKTTTPAMTLYKAYVGWCSQKAEKPEANNVFARMLLERGITKKRGRGGVIYQGIGLTISVAANVVAPTPKSEKAQ
jgi:putative DNA primase/helicase